VEWGALLAAADSAGPGLADTAEEAPSGLCATTDILG